MSSQREVIIRMLALLQRKKFIETKNRTLKCLKRHYSTVRSMKCCILFLPHPGGFDSSRVLTPGNLPFKAEKMLMPGGQPGEGGWWGGGGGAQLELTDALKRSWPGTSNTAIWASWIVAGPYFSALLPRACHFLTFCCTTAWNNSVGFTSWSLGGSIPPLQLESLTL